MSGGVTHLRPASAVWLLIEVEPLANENVLLVASHSPWDSILRSTVIWCPPMAYNCRNVLTILSKETSATFKAVMPRNATENSFALFQVLNGPFTGDYQTIGRPLYEANVLDIFSEKMLILSHVDVKSITKKRATPEKTSEEEKPGK